MHRLAILGCLAALLLSACLTRTPTKLGYVVEGSRVQWNGMTMDYFATLHRVPMPEADAATFQEACCRFGLDSQKVYYRGEPLSGADPATWRAIGEAGYSTDGALVFYETKRLEGANGAAWRLIGDAGYSSDGVHVFYGTKRLEGADPSTFRLHAFERAAASDAKSLYYFDQHVGSVQDCGPPMRSELAGTRIPFYCRELAESRTATP